MKEEPILQHVTEHREGRSIRAPTAAVMDVPGQGSESADQLEDDAVERIAAMQDTLQQTTNHGKADAPVILEQQTTDVVVSGGKEDRNLRQAQTSTEYVLETEVEPSATDEHLTGRIKTKSVSTAAGTEPIEGATVLNESTSQDVIILD